MTFSTIAVLAPRDSVIADKPSRKRSVQRSNFTGEIEVDGAMYCIQSRTHFLNSAPPLRELVEIDGTLPSLPDLILAIHLLRKTPHRVMDTRVKPASDGRALVSPTEPTATSSM